MIGEKAAIRLLRKVIQESPADQTETLLLTEDSSLTRFARSSIHQHVAEKNGTLILRVVLGKRIAVVTTNILSLSSAKASLERAISLAKVQHNNETFISLPEPKSIPSVMTFAENVS